MLNDVVITYFIRLQSTVSLSTFEADYTALVEYVRDGFVFDGPMGNKLEFVCFYVK